MSWRQPGNMAAIATTEVLPCFEVPLHTPSHGAVPPRRVREPRQCRHVATFVARRVHVKCTACKASLPISMLVTDANHNAMRIHFSMLAAQREPTARGYVRGRNPC